MKVKTLMNMIEDFGEDREVVVLVTAIGGQLAIKSVTLTDGVVVISTEAEEREKQILTSEDAGTLDVADLEGPSS